jgi:hypothetical protein
MSNLIAGASTLAQALNLIWADDDSATAAVPADRFLNGRVPGGEEMPYVRMETQDGGNIQRTNATNYQKQKITFHIWTDTFDAGDSIVPVLKATFASQAFDWGSGGVTDFRQEGTASTSQVTTPEFKAWETIVTFTANTWETRQDHS